MFTSKLPLKSIKLMKFHHLVLLSFICLFSSCQSTKPKEPGANYVVNLTSDAYWKVFPNNDQNNMRTDASTKIRVDVPQKEVIIHLHTDSIVYKIDSFNLSIDSILTIYATIDEDLSAEITANCRDFNQRLIVHQHSRNYRGKNYDIQYKISSVNDELLPKTDIEQNEHFYFFDISLDCTAPEMVERLKNKGFNYRYHTQIWTHMTGYIDDILCNICIEETSKSHMVHTIRVELHTPFSDHDVVALLNTLVTNYGNFKSPYSWFMLKYEEPRGSINIYELAGNLDIRFIDKIHENLDYREIVGK